MLRAQLPAFPVHSFDCPRINATNWREISRQYRRNKVLFLRRGEGARAPLPGHGTKREQLFFSFAFPGQSPLQVRLRTLTCFPQCADTGTHAQELQLDQTKYEWKYSFSQTYCKHHSIYCVLELCSQVEMMFVPVTGTLCLYPHT